MTNPSRFITILPFLALLFATTLLTPSLSSPLQHLQAQTHLSLKFQNQLSAINQKLQRLLSIIDSTNQTTGIQLGSNSSALNNKDRQLSRMEKQLKIRGKLKICHCKLFSQSKQQYLQQLFNQYKSNLNTLQNILNTSLNISSKSLSKMNQSLAKLKNYQNYTSSVINSSCCKQIHHFQDQIPSGLVNLNNTLFKDNLKAPNWYYGSIKQSDYQLQQFQLSTKFNVTSCPIDQPFLNIQQNTCHNCTPQGSMFNLGTRSCYYCGAASYLNLTTSMCQYCPANNYYNFTINACQQCTGNMYLNVTTQKCQLCPDGQSFNNNTSQCIACPANYQYDQSTNVCRLCNSAIGQFYDATTHKCGQCPAPQFYNTTSRQCQSCSSTQFFNYTLNRCDQCPPGYRFDNIYQLCVLQSNSSSNSSSNTSASCSSGFYFDQASGLCLNSNNIGICPDSKPYFNITINQCVTCPVGTTYDPSRYVCVNSYGQIISHLLQSRIPNI